MTDEEVAEHLRLARERLAAARWLLEDAFLRDAASRAYYAMFHAAYALVRTEGHAPKTHRGLGNLLGGHFTGAGSLTEEQLADFRRAQGVRVRSEYEAGFSVDEETVQHLVDRAEAFLGAVEAIVGS